MHITQAELKEALSYDPETGVFVWTTKNPRNQRIGKTAGVLVSRGYVWVGFRRRKHAAHRLTWLYMHGEWPDRDIDHINGDRSDNRISNLRLATRAENLQNQRKGRGASGLLGVTFAVDKGKFKASIKTNYKNKHLGYFDSPEAAHAAYVTAKRQLHATCML